MGDSMIRDETLTPKVVDNDNLSNTFLRKDGGVTSWGMACFRDACSLI